MTEIIIVSAFILIIAVLAVICRKFRHFDTVNEEIIKRELKRRAEALKSQGIISSEYDFMVGASECRKII